MNTERKVYLIPSSETISFELIYLVHLREIIDIHLETIVKLLVIILLST